MTMKAEHDMGPVEVIGLGECSVDRVCRVAEYPRAGDKLRAELRELPGGQVMTALLALRRLGLPTCLIGAVGDDADGAYLRGVLGSAGIAAEIETIVGGRTRSATVIVDGHGERTILEHEDSRVQPSAALLDSPLLVGGRALHLDVTFPAAAIVAARRARAAGLFVSADVDTLPAGVVEQLFPLLDQLVVSAQVQDLLGVKGPEAALEGLRAHCPGLVCITLGEGGSLALDSAGKLHRMDAFALKVVDTTGCGDVFCAGLLLATLEGRVLDEALRFASAAAALAATGQGAQGHLPTRREVEALLAG